MFPSSPFSAPLSFDGLTDFALPPMSIPLFDAPPPPTPMPEDRGISIDAYQLEPTTDLALRPMAGTPFDPQAIRREFPILQKPVNGKRLVWLDTRTAPA